MNAAVVRAAGETPQYAPFAEPPSGGELVDVAVTAAALSPLAKARASGDHYSSSGAFPRVAGVDGVGRLGDGRRVFFMLPDPPFGSMAERVAIAAERIVAIPDDLDDVTAAAIANPGMSSWAALTRRAHLQPGETVLVNGATGVAGRLAVQIARRLGAARVVATGRNAAMLEQARRLGADAVISLAQDDAGVQQAFDDCFARERVTVVLDYLWGSSALAIVRAVARTAPKAVAVRFVQIGSVAGPEISLASANLRSSALELLGSGLGSVPLPELVRSIAELMTAAPAAKFEIATRAVPLSRVAENWDAPGDSARTVFTVA